MPLFFRGLLCVQLLLLISIQGFFWLSQRSLPSVWGAQARVAELNLQNQGLHNRNADLLREIEDLKTGRALEGRARLDLGMIKPEESFYVIIESAQ